MICYNDDPYINIRKTYVLGVWTLSFFWEVLLDQRCQDSLSMPTDSNGRQLFSLQFTALFWWLMYLNYYATSSHQRMNLHTNESMVKFQ